MKKRISKIIGTFLGVGYFPYGPGTFATLISFPIILMIYNFYISLVLFVIVSIAGIVSGNYLYKDYGDASFFVIDEVAGVWVGLLFVFDSSLPWKILVVLLFRMFDIFKPFPVNKFDELKNGFGIMADDIVAGILAGILVYIIIVVWHILF